MDPLEKSQNIAGKDFILSGGKLANQADGSIVATLGGTVVLATCVVGKEPAELDYMPLQVDYEERFYASGKISGSRFIKREGRPSEEAVLTSRLIDRPLRPLFPKYFRHEVQIITTVLSYDGVNDPDILSMIASSAAVMASPAPFAGPVGAARVGIIGGEFVLNPTKQEMIESDLDIVAAGTKDRILMIEAGAKEVPEDKMIEAIEFARSGIDASIELQRDFINPDRMSPEDHTLEIQSGVTEQMGDKIKKIVIEDEAKEKELLYNQTKEDILSVFEGKYKKADLEEVFDKLIYKQMRKIIMDDKKRPDGRAIDEIRSLSVEVDVLPQAHGSGLFSRGESQSLTIATLGAPGKEQFIDTMEMEGTKKFMHHYNLPPFSTGDIKRVGSASRREIGHGALAERALLPMIPPKEEFPYTIRLVSEILSSNGSTSMAATCGSTLALMSAGVPIKKPVAGIAMGLVTRPKTDDKDRHQDDKYDYEILTDLQGVEDFGGDMDFKIAGTRDGITAIQLDVKNDGLSLEMIKETFTQAKIGRDFIMEKMLEVIPEPRSELSAFAPRVTTMKIDPEKIGEVIGPGGKNINAVIEAAGGKDKVAVDIEDDGTIMVSSNDAQAAKVAIEMLEGQTKDVEVGEVYSGKVISIQKDRISGKEIGAIVEVLPGKTGMVHISQVAPERIDKVSDKLKVGDVVKVKVLDVDPVRNRIALSIKQNGENLR